MRRWTTFWALLLVTTVAGWTLRWAPFAVGHGASTAAAANARLGGPPATAVDFDGALDVEADDESEVDDGDGEEDPSLGASALGVTGPPFIELAVRRMVDGRLEWSARTEPITTDARFVHGGRDPPWG